MNRLPFFGILALCVFTCGACSTAVSKGNNHLANLQYGSKPHPGAGASTASISTASANMHEEMAVVQEIRKAWKLATIENDRDGAMEILVKLDKEHPGISTVQMMMGQVEEHFGNEKKAVTHYRKAHNVNEFSSVQTYKLAESLRKSGDAKGSVIYYQKLEKRLETAVHEFKREDFKQLLGSVRVGLAEAMLDSGSKVDEVYSILEKLKDADATSKKRAARVLHKLLMKHPDYKEAKMLLKEYE